MGEGTMILYRLMPWMLIVKISMYPKQFIPRIQTTLISMKYDQQSLILANTEQSTLQSMEWMGIWLRLRWISQWQCRYNHHLSHSHCLSDWDMDNKTHSRIQSLWTEQTMANTMQMNGCIDWGDKIEMWYYKCTRRTMKWYHTSEMECVYHLFVILLRACIIWFN